MNGIGVVAIGRNEGERLRRCLATLTPFAVPVVYVDSGSSDGSVELAQGMGAFVVQLDDTIPFTAARARNAGFQCLLQANPTIRFVQFLDSDCEVSRGWFEVAVPYLQSESEIAVVCGRRRERFPNASLYNRLIDLEWDTPVGALESCGGDALMKAELFAAVGRFDETIAAGEEPEYCHRLIQAGYRIARIDAEMTMHDASILLFRQWWRRHQRSGYGGLDVQSRFGVKLFDRELFSARVWTIGFVILVLLACVVGGFARGSLGCWMGVMAAVAIWSLQTLRVSRNYQRKGFRWTFALRAGVISMLVKWANLIGQLRYYQDRRHGRFSRLIEYKKGNNPSGSHQALAGEAVTP
jgi:glycosyltransferase involved in cell wall biosynthesis